MNPNPNITLTRCDKRYPLGVLINLIVSPGETKVLLPGHLGRIACGEYLEHERKGGHYDEAMADIVQLNPDMAPTIVAYCNRMEDLARRSRACN
jgi:hypothetical protein